MPSGRHILVLACALVASLAVAAAAFATKVTIDSHLTPVLRAFPSRPVPATLSIALNFAGDDGGEPPVLQQAKIQFPWGANFNGNLFPFCDPVKMENKGTKACPKGSKIGTGFAIGSAAGGSIRQKVDVTLFNGKGGKSIVFYLVGNGDPLSFAIPFAGPFQTFGSGDWHYGLTVDVPTNLQRVAGVDVSVEQFNVKVGATRVVHGRKRGLIEALICPPGALVPIRGTFSFLDNPTVTQNSYVHCGA
jgi:hypothetical protein